MALQTLWPYSLTKPDFFSDLGCSPGYVLTKKEVGDRPFFYIFDTTNSSSYGGKSLIIKLMLENFRANVFNIVLVTDITRALIGYLSRALYTTD